MARFRCRVCSEEGTFEYKSGRHACPRCGSPDVQFAIAIAEMPDELLDELIQTLSQAERLDSPTRTNMKIITIVEEDSERARSVYVRADGDVTVFDRGRKFRFRCDIAGAETTWQIMVRVTPHVVAAEARAIEIETLAYRCRTGWFPVAEEIGADVPQRTMLRSGFGVDLMRYPHDPELVEYSRATLLMGRDETGRGLVTGEILWIDAAQRWAVCEDGFWWSP